LITLITCKLCSSALCSVLQPPATSSLLDDIRCSYCNWNWGVQWFIFIKML
jgi:hypothetical protein